MDKGHVQVWNKGKKKKNTIILCSHKIEGRERIKINEKYYLS
jgi:hypothetical protein